MNPQEITAYLSASHIAVVATVFPDSSSKYLSTDVMREELVREGYVTPDVELTGFTTYNRLCQACAVNVDP